MYIPSTLWEMPKGALFNCKNLRKVLVAEGCKVDVKHCVWLTVNVETVAPGIPDADESNSVQIELEDEEAFRKKLVEKDAQIEELRRQMQKIIQ